MYFFINLKISYSIKISIFWPLKVVASNNESLTSKFCLFLKYILESPLATRGLGALLLNIILIKRHLRSLTFYPICICSKNFIVVFFCFVLPLDKPATIYFLTAPKLKSPF